MATDSWHAWSASSGAVDEELSRSFADLLTDDRRAVTFSERRNMVWHSSNDSDSRAREVKFDVGK